MIAVLSMTPDMKRALMLIYLTAFSTFLTVYAANAYSVARYAFDTGSEIGWCTTPPGSFLPWPRRSGPLIAVSKMNAIDLVAYRYLIKSGVLKIATALLWIATALLAYRLVKRPRARKSVPEIRTFCSNVWN